jgi:hypothetical protein
MAFSELRDNDEICQKCRFNPDLEMDFNCMGGSCASCKDHDNFKPEKCYDPKLCAKCDLENDPCHYLCVECQNGNNYQIPPTRVEEIQNEINLLKQKQAELERELITIKGVAN